MLRSSAVGEDGFAQTKPKLKMLFSLYQNASSELTGRDSHLKLVQDLLKHLRSLGQRRPADLGRVGSSFRGNQGPIHHHLTSGKHALEVLRVKTPLQNHDEASAETRDLERSHNT